MSGEGAPPGRGRVDVGRGLRHTWIAYWIVLAFFMTPMVLAVAAAAHGAADGRGDTTPSALLGGAAAVGVPLLGFSAFLIMRAPRYLAAQGVELSARGLALVRGPRWWAPGTTAFVPWADVHHVVHGLRQGTGARRTLEIHLRRRAGLPEGVPHWAAPVPAGRERWGSTAARPRIILDADAKLLTALVREFTLWRPDLCADLIDSDDAPAPETVPVPAPDDHPSADAASPHSPDPRPPATPAPAPGRETGPASPPPDAHRVDMRWQQAGGWLLATGVCAYLTGGCAVLTLVWGLSGDYGAAVITLFLILPLALITRLLLRMAPRYTARQELVADRTGITLLQEPKGAFPGLRVHIPWSQVLHVRQDARSDPYDTSRGVHYYVDVRTREPLYGTDLPHWTSLDGPTLRVRSKRSTHAALVRALRAARPDLLPGG